MKEKVVINPQYQKFENLIIEIPRTFGQKGTILYGGRNIIKVVDFDDIEINIKSFKNPNFINKVVYGNFRKSKARRSFEYANILLENNIKTPTPIAYIEDTNGLLFKSSYYLSAHETFDGLMREFNRGILKGREDLLSQFALFTADMHQKKIMHLDYSPGNILYKKRNDVYIFYLVDLNRMYFGDVSMDAGCHNLRRLWGSNEMISFIAKEYAKFRGFDIDSCIQLTLKYHAEFWRKFSKKHKDKKPYLGEI